MPIDPRVILGVAAAVEAAPDNVPLRVHLAGLLLDDGQPAVALEHCVAALAREPDNATALDQAARAAEAVGDHVRAAGYRRLHTALTGAIESQQPLETSEDPTAQRPLSADVEISEEDVDEFLREVLGEGDASPSGRITLADVAGLDDVKRRLERGFLGAARNSKLREMYGKALRGGLLLYGPPGCGKTYLARAVAGELGVQFMSVGLHDVLDMWLGNSEKNVHRLFELARDKAPCVLFFDEIDALGQSRANLNRSAGRNAVVQLLAELDGVDGRNEGLFVLAATNQPWDVDVALRRPGRFDRMLLVLPPDRAAREAILRFHLSDRPVGAVDIARLAARTERFSGADLCHLAESATEFALEDALATGDTRPIQQADFDRALADLRPSTTPWFEVARNYAEYANGDGTYDDLLAYLRKHRLR